MTLRVLDGIRALGVPVRTYDAPHPRAILPGVWIESGILGVCPWAVMPGDILHEAGHLAVWPSRFRHLIGPGSIDEVDMPHARAVLEYMTSREAFSLGVDHWLFRALLQSGEDEANAWSYAAALAVDLPPEQVFMHRYPGDVPHRHQPYQGEGESVMWGLVRGSSLGINGLQAAGMCRIRNFPGQDPVPLWPKMIRWMQD